MSPAPDFPPGSPATSPSVPFRLSPLAQAFVLHFGEMGSRWGINRTVGQIYAMLFLADAPRHAEEIAEALTLSRGSVSMGLKELASWNLVQLRHVPGDRRDYYETPRDVWSIFRTLVEERKKREIDPTLTTLRTLRMEPATDASADRFAQERIDADARTDRAADRLVCRNAAARQRAAAPAAAAR